MRNTIRNQLIRILLGFCFCIHGTAFAQQVELTVDRSELARGETLTLTLRVYDQRQGMQLDLTPLTTDFDVLGTRTSSQIRSINGAVEAWTDYIVTLFPLGEGELTIPAITINNTATTPITITVLNQGPRSNQSSEELFLELETNKDSLYVQEQLLFTVRLYYTINGIRNPQFTELEMPDTVIQLIGSPNQYEKLIDSVRYGVYEKRYVIFPQRSGPLEIPDILFRGEVTDGSSNFVFRNLNTRRVTAFIEGITIDVKERPASARQDNFWLPVANLALTEVWNPPLENVKVGDSVTRTITMVADGLDGAVLPPFSGLEIAGANVYPEPPAIERTFVDGSIVGTRVETVAIVPTTSGFLDIPQISVPWWNINTDAAEVAVAPATRIAVATIAGEAPAEQLLASSGDLERLLAEVPMVDPGMLDAQDEAEVIAVNSIWLNIAIVASFLIVAASVYRLVLRPNRKAIDGYLRQQRARIRAYYSPANNEGVAFNQLVAACRGNNLQQVRLTLVQWSGHFVTQRRVRSMEDILQQTEAAELHAPVQQIQSALYNAESSKNFNGRELLSVIKELRSKRRRSQKQQKQQVYALPPLYKT